MGEGGHDRRAARSRGPVLERDKPELAHLVTQPVVGDRLDREDRFEIIGLGDLFEQLDRRKTAGDDPVAGPPPDRADGELLH